MCKKELELDIIGLMCIPPNDNKDEKYFSEVVIPEMMNEMNLKTMKLKVN